MKYPPIPKTLSMPGGDVTIVKREKLKHEDGAACWGIWHDDKRLIELDSTAEMRHQWKVLFHELTHAALDDSGLSNGMHDDLVEAVCDAMSVARMRERFG